jgi:hypothetical protein
LFERHCSVVSQDRARLRTAEHERHGWLFCVS